MGITLTYSSCDSIDKLINMKKIHRFLIEALPQKELFTLEDRSFVHQIKNVLKFSVGEEIVLFSPFGNDFKCRINAIEKDGIDFEVIEEIEKIKIPRSVIACISIVKKDNFELITQKLAEIGVGTLIPILSERTVKQSLNIDRLEKISIEALEQSGHSNKMTICEPLKLQEALKQNKEKLSIYFDMEGASTEQGLIECFYIGPEGGWSEEEKDLFKSFDIKACSLGATTLRAETASIVASDRLIWG